MIYMKHTELGNKHVDASQQAEREAAGWVKWPRSKEEKSGHSSEYSEPLRQFRESDLSPSTFASEKKKPGPKPKAK